MVTISKTEVAADHIFAEPDGGRPIDQDGQSDRVADDLDWILSKFAGRVFADEAVLSLHRDDNSPELLARVSPNRALLSDPHLAVAIACQDTDALHYTGQGARVAWHELTQVEEAKRAMTLAVAQHGGLRLILTALYRHANMVQRLAAEQMAKKLQPVLAGYFRLWLHARSQQRALIAYKSALDLSDVAIIILDGHGAVIGENAIATLMFQKRDVVHKSRYSLVAVNRGETTKLHAAMDHASHDGEAVLISLSRKNYRRPLMALLSPTFTRPEISADPSFVLCIYDSDTDVTLALQRCCDAYRLTKTEGQLVHHLVCGLALNDAAARMKIAEATARSYLKQIFGKTATHRQSDLIRVMLSSIARTSLGHFSAL
ncbi:MULTISPECIES: helix-turn-helix transcriptional regulator [unclassified Sphingobium]|uniref:helix-turn-helix transcriptional regulator n=1 Tax=unclassified Sphingobium TaxID=2611147 RepID=UPI002225189C|nr:MULTISPECIES: hypothetical protein [unclassified Sphingobium]MCW2395911.1 DNA-binding CsgD family transcriptional regulator/PAS domain-containing protein [Sphingobium sp. B8D3B]MCW2419427.1 DNA-binding CsgD family transcriptional regulator/PAS domain-containing protein [Sphingobium sp. B8D3C]